MRGVQTAFTLIELIIVVAVVGMLASLATSAYQTYKIRAQVAEGVQTASAAEMQVIDAYRRDGSAPAGRIEAGMAPNPSGGNGDYVSLINISNGRVDMTFGGKMVHAEIIGETLSITPYETAGGAFVWRCGNAPAPASGRLMNGGDGHQSPSIENRYLPSACRN